MRQEQLAAELDVSRTPLREALRMLEREGLVRVEPGRSVRVISGDLTTLCNAYAVREVLDGLAARLVAEQGSNVVVEPLEAILDRQATTLDPWDPNRYTETNVEFHSVLIAAPENNFLRAQLPLVHMTSQVFIPIARVSAQRAERASTSIVRSSRRFANDMPTSPSSLRESTSGRRYVRFSSRQRMHRTTSAPGRWRRDPRAQGRGCAGAHASVAALKS